MSTRHSGFRVLRSIDSRKLLFRNFGTYRGPRASATASAVALRASLTDAAGPGDFRRFSTPWVVIASARGFTGNLKAGGPEEILSLAQEGTRWPATPRAHARPQSPGCWPSPGGTLI